MTQQAYSGGGTSEGHRYVEVSKTVTQQPRPFLEREISASQQATKQRKDPSVKPIAAGAATAVAGAGVIGSARNAGRSLGDIAAAHKQAAAEAGRAQNRARGAVDRHVAQQNRHVTERTAVEGQMAKLKAWEATDGRVPHEATIRQGTGRMTKYTIRTGKGTKQHDMVSRALQRQHEDAQSAIEHHGHQANLALKEAGRHGKKFLEHQNQHYNALSAVGRAAPKLARRTAIGRGLVGAGTLGAVAGGVRAERQRQINKAAPKHRGRGKLLRLDSHSARMLSLVGAGVAGGATYSAAKERYFGKSAANLGRVAADTVQDATKSPKALRAALGGPRATELNARLGRAKPTGSVMPTGNKVPKVPGAALPTPLVTPAAPAAPLAPNTTSTDLASMRAKLAGPGQKELASRLAMARNPLQ